MTRSLTFTFIDVELGSALSDRGFVAEHSDQIVSGQVNSSVR